MSIQCHSSGENRCYRVYHWRSRRNMSHNFSLGCLLKKRQQSFSQWKHTVLLTWPSATTGWVPLIQPGALVLHLRVGGHEVGILVPAAPPNRYHPGPIPLSHPEVFAEYVSLLSLLVRLWKVWHSDKERKDDFNIQAAILTCAGD